MNVRQIFSRILTRWGSYVFYAVVLACIGLGVYQAITWYRGEQYVRTLAQNITAVSKSNDTGSTVTFLRDYIRQNVTHINFPAFGRGVMRNTAEMTLRNGKGRCGEATRAFINMADAVGIHAQRLYLEGKRRHVVALVTLQNGKQLIVDSTDTPYFEDLETLDQLPQHPEFDYHSSFNQQYLMVPLRPNTISLGSLGYYMENPPVLMAIGWFTLAAVLLALRFIRYPIRLLEKRQHAAALRANHWRTAPASSGTI